MNYLFVIPIGLIAGLLILICSKFKLKFLKFVFKIILIACIIYFIYDYAKGLGFDIVQKIKDILPF